LDSKRAIFFVFIQKIPIFDKLFLDTKIDWQNLESKPTP
jgi:hypothetical protein